jgi:hypothetical protein
MRKIILKYWDVASFGEWMAVTGERGKFPPRYSYFCKKCGKYFRIRCLTWPNFKY